MNKPIEVTIKFTTEGDEAAIARLKARMMASVSGGGAMLFGTDYDTGSAQGIIDALFQETTVITDHKNARSFLENVREVGQVQISAKKSTRKK